MAEEKNGTERTMSSPGPFSEGRERKLTGDGAKSGRRGVDHEQQEYGPVSSSLKFRRKIRGKSVLEKMVRHGVPRHRPPERRQRSKINWALRRG